MTGYAFAAVWGAFVLCSMVGWGGLLTGMLRRRIGWARDAAVGFAFSACLGGVLDLTGTISRALIIGFLALGVVALVYRYVRSSATRREGDRHVAMGPRWIVVPVVTVVCALLLVRVAGSVVTLQPPQGMQPGSFNTFDDFQAYIVYPLKMLDTGTMGSDPFSVRRTPTVALGGNAFLQTFVLAVLPVQNLRLLDVGLGTVLIAGLLWWYTARLGLTLAAAASVVFVFLAVPPPLINVTGVLIPTALFVSLFCLFVERDGPRFARAALIGMHIAAICAVKTSLVPAAIACAGAQWVLDVWHSAGGERRQAFIEGFTWFVWAAVALVPWLLDSYWWTGAFVSGGLAAYHAHPSFVAAFDAVTGWPFLIQHLNELPRPPYVLIAVLSGVVLVHATRFKVPAAFWSLLAGSVVGTLGVTLAVGGSVNDIQRFMYAFLMSMLLIALGHAIAALAALQSAITRRVAFAGLGAATLWVLLSTARPALKMYWFNVSTTVRALRGERLIAPELAAKYRALQSAVPEGAVVLERMDYPFLFDFRRNPILLADMPGMASHSPGQPFFAGSEALASYLTSRGIRYLAFDYLTEAGVPRRDVLAALADDERHPSAQALVRLIFDFHDSARQLGETRQRVFDDGSAFVADLLTRAR